MNTAEQPILAICNPVQFPILSAHTDQPCNILMACDDLKFFASRSLDGLRARINKGGTQWHEYGDVRWSSKSAWVEFPLIAGGFAGPCGVAVLCVAIPPNERDVFDWIAQNGPLSYLFPEERSASAIRQKAEMLRNQSVCDDFDGQRDDSNPCFVQSYCIFHMEHGGEVKFVATYNDLLNGGGIPIPKFRMASVDPDNVQFCRFALHSLFCLNESRIEGADFLELSQLKKFEPTWLPKEQKNPRWAQFHPSRILRRRPDVRALPTPTNLFKGILNFEDFEKVMEVRRREANIHMLGFARAARPHTMATLQNDGDCTITAVVHKANGGAIYLLPHRLVEEFDNTDCGEVQIGDIKLPFPVIFLKFTPPEPVFLADECPVDGCYVAKQDDEYLFTLTSRIEGVDYERSLSVVCLDPTFSLHLPAKVSETSINVAVEQGIEDFLSKNAPPTEDMSRDIERPDGTVAHLVDVRAQSRLRRINLFRSQEASFRMCLNIIVNASCFITFRPDDIEEAWEGEPPKDLLEAANENAKSRKAKERKRDALRKIRKGDYTRVKICGAKLFGDATDAKTTGAGKSPRAHWRRGHWRRQRHGAGLAMITLRWIRPTIVKKDNGPLVEARIYDVDSPASEPSDAN